VLGLIVGSVGVVVIAAPWNISFEGSGADQLLAQLACLGANACYAISYVLQRRLLRGGQYDPTSIAASQILLAALLGLLLAPLIGGLEPVQLSVPVVVSLALLGMLGTGLAYIWVNNIIVTWGPTPASTVTYVTPVVGVVLGIVVLGETLHWNEPVGGVIILLGVLLTQGVLRSRS
jgi:drug/metabolite transporter (DMT)-like permease